MENKIDIKWNTRKCTPLLIDLETREVVWIDLPHSSSGNYNWGWGGNNIESNMASSSEIMEMSASMANMKTTLGDVFRLHAEARGDEIVDNRGDADYVFAWDGDVTPYDISLINSEFLS